MADLLLCVIALAAIGLPLSVPRDSQAVWRGEVTWRKRLALFLLAGAIGTIYVLEGLPNNYATGLLAFLGASVLFHRFIARSPP
jgi:hypothetical protein